MSVQKHNIKTCQPFNFFQPIIFKHWIKVIFIKSFLDLRTYWSALAWISSVKWYFLVDCSLSELGNCSVKTVPYLLGLLLYLLSHYLSYHTCPAAFTVPTPAPKFLFSKIYLFTFSICKQNSRHSKWYRIGVFYMCVCTMMWFIINIKYYILI